MIFIYRLAYVVFIILKFLIGGILLILGWIFYPVWFVFTGKDVQDSLDHILDALDDIADNLEAKCS